MGIRHLSRQTYFLNEITEKKLLIGKNWDDNNLFNELVLKRSVFPSLQSILHKEYTTFNHCTITSNLEGIISYIKTSNFCYERALGEIFEYIDGEFFLNELLGAKKCWCRIHKHEIELVEYNIEPNQMLNYS